MTIRKKELVLYPQNAKKHPDKQIEQIAASLERFGWQQPIKVGKGNTIIVGHGRWLAYQKYPDRIKEPWIINESGATISGEPEPRPLTVEEEKAYRLADNKLNESNWDMELALAELDDLDLELQELAGFDVQQEQVAEEDDFDPDSVDKKEADNFVDSSEVDVPVHNDEQAPNSPLSFEEERKRNWSNEFSVRIKEKAQTKSKLQLLLMKNAISKTENNK